MMNRPTFIDLRAHSHGGFDSGHSSPRALPSPRMHVAGEIPPDLSPLDAFAFHSRLLAKQLEEESAKEGQRLSNLPSLGITTSLGVRPGIIRSASTSEAINQANNTILSPSGEGLGLREVEAPTFRPVSVYPRVSGVPSFEDFDEPLPTRPDTHDEERFRGREPPTFVEGSGTFGARREESPAALHREKRSPRQAKSPSPLQHRLSNESMRQRGQLAQRGLDGPLNTRGYDSRALAPPRSPMFPQRAPSPSAMSVTSERNPASLNTAGLHQRRRLSSGSGISISPISPVMYNEGRSPSMSSEISVGSARLPRPAFNFSRPLSRASLPPVEVPSRQASEDSQPSFVLADDTAHTPVSMHSDGFPEPMIDGSGAPSYVYSRFSLPRGKMLQRNSLIFQEGLPQAQFQWEEPLPFSNVQGHNGGRVQAPPSPPTRPSLSSQSQSYSPDSPQTKPSLAPARPSWERAQSSDARGRTSLEHVRFANQQNNRNLESSNQSFTSDSTIRARRSMHSLAPSSEHSAEEHVSKAIELHEQGALKESTYHLRLAARQNHPTAMLLYALACRHGWGMRPNQKEGVHWLRKAADFASLEVADDESTIKDGKPVDILEQKTRKAQFALSIYELGVSHMNGWGIEQDKVLALRCFEIAGSWGDADALAEAGFCYAQGVGCKKDLKKSAKFYRQAEAKGISMIGNSWIYKSKYNDPDDNNASKVSPDKKTRSKSKTRGMFGRRNRAINE
ncbi:hypothetical protein PVAG01_04126 [Phlyctema vagabunda]|uniref:Uncharacterized protein n=1 Tax=Phlyctema vagabunda TaxID=108571 RepID=A0ABR4PNE3_9HELO